MHGIKYIEHPLLICTFKHTLLTMIRFFYTYVDRQKFFFFFLLAPYLTLEIKVTNTSNKFTKIKNSLKKFMRQNKLIVIEFLLFQFNNLMVTNNVMKLDIYENRSDLSQNLNWKSMWIVDYTAIFLFNYKKFNKFKDFLIALSECLFIKIFSVKDTFYSHKYHIIYFFLIVKNISYW